MQVKRMKKVNVPLGNRTYPIFFANNVLTDASRILKPYVQGKTIMIITDTNIDPLYGQTLQSTLKSEGFNVHKIVIPAGEKSKTLETSEILYNRCLEANLDRTSTIISLGGGVVGDISGFVAATYMRGIDFIQVPTSLLAQVDSSVGGKVGVNLPAAKNAVGAFHQPRAVIIDVSLLKTLPAGEFRSGLSEIIKYGVIWDKAFFDWLEENIDDLKKDDDKLQYAVIQSCRIKAEIVSQDEREKGLRAILNFGHTIGHAIESAAGYGRYTHGEAVAIGQVYESSLAVHTGFLKQQNAHKIKRLIQNAGLPVDYADIAHECLIERMLYDKKNVDTEPVFILPMDIGEVKKVKISLDNVRRFLERAREN